MRAALSLSHDAYFKHLRSFCDQGHVVKDWDIFATQHFLSAGGYERQKQKKPDWKARLLNAC